jgi:hypothetical protein
MGLGLIAAVQAPAAIALVDLELPLLTPRFKLLPSCERPAIARAFAKTNRNDAVSFLLLKPQGH